MPHLDASLQKTSGVPAPRDLRVLLQPVADAATLAPLWRDLELRADASFFLSWHWIGSWLVTLPPEVHPYLLLAQAEGTVVGLALFSPHTAHRHGLFPRRSLHLHETGVPILDSLTIEYNGLLVDRRHGRAVAASCLDWLVRNAAFFDELVLRGVDREIERMATEIAVKGKRRIYLRGESPSLAVDLDAVRERADGYLGTLSANTRHAVRRSVRLYEARGPLEFRIADSVDEALDYFGDLKHLHQDSWNRRGQPGAFACPTFESFHRSLIRSAFEHGHIRLCRISVGGAPIGYLYNLVWRGRVCSYQSGFRYNDDNRLKPGLTSHYLAIQDSLARGDRWYDFMAGDSQYKRSLSNHSERTVSLGLRTNTLAFRLESQLRSLKSRVRF